MIITLVIVRKGTKKFAYFQIFDYLCGIFLKLWQKNVF